VLAAHDAGHGQRAALVGNQRGIGGGVTVCSFNSSSFSPGAG
jgi:hypothetical protein